MRDGLDALPFFNRLAFGLRASLFGRISPLAIPFPFGLVLLLERVSFGPCVGPALEPLEQRGARGPRFGASLERSAHVTVGDSSGASLVVSRQPEAPLGGVLALSQGLGLTIRACSAGAARGWWRSRRAGGA
jgi:hypothetical protein